MGKFGSTRKGLGLATTLSLTALVALLAFVCVGACFAQLAMATRVERLSEAESGADSVSNLAAARLLADSTFGTHGDADQRSLQVTLPQGTARLTFDADRAAQWGIPVSRNNLESDEPLPGFQRTIPAQSVQLLAQGQAGGTVRLIEVIVNQPPFKWAVASTGNIHSSGGLKVMGVKDLVSLANGVDHLPPEQILPGHVVSDSLDGQALNLDSRPDAPSLITGDAQAMGSVVLGPSTVVNGRVKAHADSAKLPTFVVQNYDPAGVEGLQEVPQSVINSALPVAGLWRRGSDLTISQGGLQMQGGYLYVDGNLEIYGGVSGKGAIFSTGNVTIHGLSRFAADNLQAIMASGDIALDGSGPEQSSFQGLMFGGGDLRATQISLVGTFLGTRPAPAGSNVELNQASLVSNAPAISFDLPDLFAAQLAPLNLQVGLGQPITLQPIVNPNLTAAHFYDPVRDLLDPNLVTDQTLGSLFYIQDGLALVRPSGNLNLTQQSRLALNLSQPATALRESMRAAVVQADKVYQNARRRGLPRGHFSLDPNQFIQTSDKMRRLLWRVVE